MGGKPIVFYSGAGHLAIVALLCVMANWVSLQLNLLKPFALVVLFGGFFAFGCVYAFAKYRVWLPMTPSLLGVLLKYGADLAQLR